MATATKPAAKQQAQQRPRSFLVGTQAVIEGGDYDQTFTVTTSSQNATPWALQATGWLRGLYLLVEGTGLTAGTVTADGPGAIFQNIELDDVNNEAIFGPFDGYTACMTNKYGGYIFAGDPYTNAIFAYTGTTSTNNITFCLFIPLEIVSRDPIGPVASVNNTASLTLRMTIAPLANVFTAATGTLAVRIRGNQSFYWEPKKTDNQGRAISPEPPAAGTTQYWTQGSIPIAGAGTINQQLITGLGYPFREYLFLLRNASGVRDETDWPDPLIGLKFEANMLLTNYPKKLWQNDIAMSYGYNGAADSRGAGTAVGKENGLYVLNWNDDFFQQKPGGETRRSYLVTSPGSNFIINGAFGAAGNLYSIVNYVAPGGGAGGRQNTASLTGGQ